MKAYLGLGANIGDRYGNLKEAVHRIGSIPDIEIIRTSPVYETVPVGGPKQPDYLNAVIEVVTELSPEKLLKCCLAVEYEMGRKRTELWGSRIIDIDIELYDSCVLKSAVLTIPHPRMHERAFVLKPIADLVPNIKHPVLGLTIKALLATVGETGILKIHNEAFII